jgi:hypothetical protein
MSRPSLPLHALDAEKKADLDRAQMVILPARARSAGARPSSRLIVLLALEQRLQLLVHPSLLGGLQLRATAQQHGRGGKVL